MAEKEFDTVPVVVLEVGVAPRLEEVVEPPGPPEPWFPFQKRRLVAGPHRQDVLRHVLDEAPVPRLEEFEPRLHCEVRVRTLVPYE